MIFAHLLVVISIWKGLSAAADVECRASSTEKVEVADGQMSGTLSRSLLQKKFGQENLDEMVSAQPVSDASGIPDEAMPRISHTRKPPPGVAGKKEYVTVRPQAGSGPDLVSFGIYGKRCYNINMNSETFTIDTVMTLQWSDSRAIALLPSGQTSLTLSEAEFRHMLWLPNVAVTNHVVHGYEVISTSVSVNSSGTVTKVERSISVIKNQYELVAFPWDSQVLEMHIASTTFMQEDVKMVPMREPDVSGVGENILYGEAFDLVSQEMSEIEEVDGSLRKSRGVLKITVKRQAHRYVYSHLIPSFLLLGMAWGVFWLPLITPFAMPRFAISCISFLSFITLTLRMDSVLPPGAPLTWNDVYDQNCETLLFAAFGLNIFAEVVMHRFSRPELAQKIQSECSVLWILVNVATLLMIIAWRGDTNLWKPRMIEAIVVAMIVGYLIWCGVRIYDPGPEGDPRKSGEVRN
mmetsp:Transcript_78542/g.168306  ORF Transcript_78542/g.168306 Transcript_78542/m.168306 type:complete len:464 (+) Transcript_78542:97-1488(+)